MFFDGGDNFPEIFLIIPVREVIAVTETVSIAEMFFTVERFYITETFFQGIYSFFVKKEKNFRRIEFCSEPAFLNAGKNCNRFVIDYGSIVTVWVFPEKTP